MVILAGLVPGVGDRQLAMKPAQGAGNNRPLGGNLGYNPQTTAGILRPEIGLVAGEELPGDHQDRVGNGQGRLLGTSRPRPGPTGPDSCPWSATARAARATHSHVSSDAVLWGLVAAPGLPARLPACCLSSERGRLAPAPRASDWTSRAELLAAWRRRRLWTL